MAQFCKACGKEVAPGLKFCVACGAAVDEGAEAAQQGYAQQDAQQGYAQGQQAGAGGAQSGGEQKAQQFFDNMKTVAQNTKDYTADYDPADVQKNKSMSCIAYILFFIPLVACPDSKFGRFHANQGLLMLILYVAAAIVTTIIRRIFSFIFLGFLASIISFVVYVALIGLMIIGILNANSGKAKDLPFVGTIRIIK